MARYCQQERLQLCSAQTRIMLNHRHPLSRLAAHEWKTEHLTFLASVFFTLFCNGSFWAKLLADHPLSQVDTWGLIACTATVLTSLQWLLMLLVTTRHTVKPLLILLTLGTASAVYFMNQYNVYLNMAMLRNLMETDVREASELLDVKMLPYAAISVALVWGIWRLKIQPASGWKQIAWRRTKALALALVLIIGAMWPVTDKLVPQFREQKELRFLITPSNYVVSSARVLGEKFFTNPRNQVLTPSAPDAKRIAVEGRKPIAFVLVVGETVRAQNWGLSGYSRDTTPELSKRGVINFKDVTSCGTDTATSVPCMFSFQGRHNYDESDIRSSESLVHVLERVGVRTLWRDNQSGCKGVCPKQHMEDVSTQDDPKFCNGKRCFDEILIQGLKEKINASKGDMFIVLHMLGNHGPAYFERYPAEFKRWQPTCDTTDLARCSREALINTYDNAIAYSDHVLAKTIDLLASIETHDTGLIYVSDHGESLGEKGLYLHGMPYAIAPAEQTHVPMIHWYSDALVKSRGIQLDCLSKKTTQPASHDHLVHTLLSLYGVQTQAQEKDWDLLQGCMSSPR